MWTAQHYGFTQPRKWINSGGLGTMGFGLPAAIGAKVACPNEQVVCIAGDGSLIMNIQELATAVNEDVPVKVFLMNNGFMGNGPPVAGTVLVGALQRRRERPEPRLVKLSEAFGAGGFALRGQRRPRGEMMIATLEHDGPACLTSGSARVRTATR